MGSYFQRGDSSCHCLTATMARLKKRHRLREVKCHRQPVSVTLLPQSPPCRQFCTGPSVLHRWSCYGSQLLYMGRQIAIVTRTPSINN